MIREVELVVENRKVRNEEDYLAVAITLASFRRIVFYVSRRKHECMYLHISTSKVKRAPLFRIAVIQFRFQNLFYYSDLRMKFIYFFFFLFSPFIKTCLYSFIYIYWKIFFYFLSFSSLFLPLSFMKNFNGKTIMVLFL